VQKLTNYLPAGTEREVERFSKQKWKIGNLYVVLQVKATTEQRFAQLEVNKWNGTRL
jgi:hypothetical protein